MIDEASIIAIIVGVTEYAKKLGLPNKLCPLFAICISIGLHVSNNYDGDNSKILDNALKGLIVGVTTTGLYAAGQNIISKKN